ncbi:hypothetical protein [Calycomorphotria hydatis]|uniref:Uncharacterized protein n=1 Tax=Calycomorphotria hydatis TaxID=2528027 RepID=A0A517T609_9PLAN|nr:hypothetical protein [Calycomorphotria hydatis]QDT63815.1 hypothetical protein V22_10400 [Calycomorphotria hydatis]
MSDFRAQNTSTPDPVRELRLRRWAREHYVAPSDRQLSWHPIVLDEMRARDIELAKRATSHVTGYVPLAPSTIHEVHEAHAGVPAPKHISMPARVNLQVPGTPEWSIVD